MCAPVAIHAIVLSEPVTQRQRACMRACVRGYGGMLEVDSGDPVCPSPAPTARITATAGGRAGWRAGREAVMLGGCTVTTCVVHVDLDSETQGGDEQVGTARVVWAAVLYLSSRSAFCSIIHFLRRCCGGKKNPQKTCFHLRR